ncbi:MAG TPA: AMP-binding protein [Steroidobacteraceae bacterium]|nr:AMP-binding protein [Steroidobacteraceae bacterium]
MQPYALTVDKFLDHAAKWHGAAEVVSAAGSTLRRTSYAQLRQRAALLSGALLDQGLRLGDRVGTLAWNTEDHLTVSYATMGAGLVCHTLNPRLSITHLAAIVNEAQDRWIAVGAGLQPMLREICDRCPCVQGVLVLDGEAPDPALPARLQHAQLNRFIEQSGRAVPWGRFDENSAAGLCYTSGTVGDPRGVLYSHRSNYLHTLRSLQADAVALTANDSVLIAVPLFHANGWGMPFAVPAVGARMVLPGRSVEPAHLRMLIERESVTVAAGVPTVWLGLIDLLESQGAQLPSLERIIVGGLHCPDALLHRMEDRLGVRVQTSWGMTELSPLGTITPPQAASGSGPRASGRPPLGLDLKLVDAEGNTLPAQRGVVGRLRVKGPSVAERYYGDPTSALDEEGYLDTGDLALIDAAGNLTVCGRVKDLIKSGGEWINPKEIEDIVGAMPAVAFAAVIGRNDEKWGERPVLVVEPQRGQSPSQSGILAALRGKVPDWWLPERIVFIEHMPLAATGKIDKRVLREHVESSR